MTELNRVVCSHFCITSYHGIGMGSKTVPSTAVSGNPLL